MKSISFRCCTKSRRRWSMRRTRKWRNRRLRQLKKWNESRLRCRLEETLRILLCRLTGTIELQYSVLRWKWKRKRRRRLSQIQKLEWLIMKHKRISWNSFAAMHLIDTIIFHSVIRNQQMVESRLQKVENSWGVSLQISSDASHNNRWKIRRELILHLTILNQRRHQAESSKLYATKAKRMYFNKETTVLIYRLLKAKIRLPLLIQEGVWPIFKLQQVQLKLKTINLQRYQMIRKEKKANHLMSWSINNYQTKS